MSLSHSRIVAVLLNSGQANAATGDAGMQDAIESARILALQLGCKPENILLCSTGVIGRRFDIQKMTAAIPTLVSKATESLDAGTSAAQAILTTDLVLKQVSYQANISGSLVTVGAMCKGSGMIHPNMATMLSVVTCDADVDPVLWRDILQRAVDKSFNVITVDGDTSTNDIVCALCSGASGASIHDSASPEAKQLEQLVADACIHMAKSIARDGEGATALLEIRASGAASDSDARAIAKTVAGSNLFKAAVFGRDPNWGRIAAATGRANIDFDINNLTIRIGDHLLMERGTPLQFDASAASQYMLSKSQASKEQYMTEHDTIVVTLQVGDGPGSGTAWGCDLSYKYVEINAEYTT